MAKKTLDIYMGDLVRLWGDLHMQSGIGLVINVKEDTEDLLDLIEINELRNGRKFLKEDEMFVDKPMALVLWANKKINQMVGNPKPIWLYFTELEIVHKLEREEDAKLRTAHFDDHASRSDRK